MQLQLVAPVLLGVRRESGHGWCDGLTCDLSKCTRGGPAPQRIETGLYFEMGPLQMWLS